MLKRLGWTLQQLVPPALLTYFFTCWRICVFEIGPRQLGARPGWRVIGLAYSAFASASIASITVLYLRLYFLPRSQSVPPYHPPQDLRQGAVVYECLSPLEEEAAKAASSSSSAGDTSATSGGDVTRGSVNRCFRQQCNGRWKPARARHCSTCGVCRMGFDHHCAIFANCLTAPYIPTFLCLLVLTPPTIFLLSSPILVPLARRAGEAWRVACTEPAVAGWWTWTPSWIVAGGPVGRWVGGLVLGWRHLDRMDGGGIVRSSIAIFVGIGGLLSAICMGLAYTTVTLVLAGRLTIDRERARMHGRAVVAMRALERRGRPVPDHVRQEINKWAEKRWFSVPTENGRLVVPTLPHEDTYDHDDRNWRFTMGAGWGWLLPWRALRMGIEQQDMMFWPLNSVVEARLRSAATRPPSS